jgi:hypothetical protein
MDCSKLYTYEADRSYREHKLPSNAGVSGSNLTRGTDDCVCVYSVCIIPCEGGGFETGRSPDLGVLPTAYGIKKLKNDQGQTNNL